MDNSNEYLLWIRKAAGVQIIVFLLFQYARYYNSAIFIVVVFIAILLSRAAEYKASERRRSSRRESERIAALPES